MASICDLVLEVVLVQVALHRDDLGDHRGAGDGGRGMPRLGPGAADRAADRLATASTSTMFFSTTALGGSGSTA